MKTIKQIADELGVSKDKIKYQVGKLPAEMVVKSEGIAYITDNGIAIIKGLVMGKSTGELPSNKDERIITLLKENIKILQAQLEIKDRQFEVKDEQIKELNARLAEAHSIINNEQLLHSGTLQKQLHSSDNEAQPLPADEQDSEDLDITIVKHENKQKKRGFFGLFNRNS